MSFLGGLIFVVCATKVDEATLEMEPAVTNEVCRFYSAEIANLPDMLDDDDDGRSTLVPLSMFAREQSALSKNIMFHSRLFFPKRGEEDEGYVNRSRKKSVLYIKFIMWYRSCPCMHRPFF